MRFAEFCEDRAWVQDDDQDLLNPMPIIQDDDAFDLMDKIDHFLISKHPNSDSLSGREYGAAIIQMRRKYGEVQDVPISKIVSTEKYLSSDHIKALQQGNAKSSSAIPLLFKDGDTYYTGDGNHRIAADYFAKKKSTRGLVLDAQKILGTVH